MMYLNQKEMEATILVYVPSAIGKEENGTAWILHALRMKNKGGDIN